MATPSELAEKGTPVGEIDVPELEATVSWADTERNASSWLGNQMQWAFYTAVRRLEPLVKEAGNSEFLRIWRYFQVSDHLHYMFTGSGGPAEVHSYFSPFDSPIDAYVNANAAILDFENRVRLALVTANEPFLFYKRKGESNYIGVMTWSLKGFAKALQTIGAESVEFHNRKGDFEKWARISLRDNALAEQLRKARLSKLEGERLRRLLVKVAKERLKDLAT